MRREERGQALIEYSILSWLLIAAIVLASSVRIAPDGEGDQKLTVVESFFQALQAYRDSVDFVLTLPVP